MTLSQKDAQLYYSLWLPLIDFVNRKYRVKRTLKNIATAKRLDPAAVKEVADKLWSDVGIIDDYLKERTDLPEEHRKCIRRNPVAVFAAVSGHGAERVAGVLGV